MPTRKATYKEVENVARSMRKAATRYYKELRKLQASIKLIHDSDMRAIKMWQEAHPGQEHVWPDRGKMIFWLLERLVGDAVYMTKKAGGYPVDGWGNCAECGGGPEGSIPHDVSCKHYIDTKELPE